MKKGIRTNIILSISAQVVSLCASFLLGLIVPKYIDMSQYAYWQTYTLYASYVGILHFGLLDGIVLRYSSYDYDNLNKPIIRSQFVWLLAFTSTATLICCSISLLLSNASKIILILVGLSIVLTNVVSYTTFIYQITNEIQKYVSVIIIERIANIAFVMLVLLIGKQDFYWFCLAPMLGTCCGILFALIKSKDIFVGALTSFNTSVAELKKNISAGAKLLAANWSAMFIIGGAKTFIQWHWSLIIFGLVSFSFSLTNLFLTFINAASVAVFPALKRTTNDKLKDLYPRLRMQVTVLLTVMLVLYYPINFFLPFWLPKYNDSLYYFGLILPNVIFNSKVYLLTNNYLKVLRQEKSMLKINVFSLILAIAGYILFTYLFNNLEMVIYWSVFIIILRFVLSEMQLSKIFKINFIQETVSEVLMCIVFAISIHVKNNITGLIIYSFAIIFYLAYILLSPQRRVLLLKTKVKN